MTLAVFRLNRMAPHNVHFGSLEEINNDKLGPMEVRVFVATAPMLSH